MSAKEFEVNKVKFSCRIGLGTAQKLARECDFHCGGKRPLDEDLSQLQADYERFGQALWLTIEPQAKERNVTPEAFFDGLDGDALNAAIESFIEALIDFLPPQNRPHVKALFQKTRELTLWSMERQASAIDAVIQKAKTEIENDLNNLTLSRSATASEE